MRELKDGSSRHRFKTEGVSNHGAKVNKGEKLFVIRSLGSLKTDLETFWRTVALAMLIQRQVCFFGVERILESCPQNGSECCVNQEC